jgi:apolipoprotein N-acyltransferase
MEQRQLLLIPAALAIGGGLWFVMNMEPIWWLAWFLPGLLFALALRTGPWLARILVMLAALIGASSNLAYFLKVMPLPAVMIVLLLQSLMWVLILGTARRIVRAYGTAWTLLALPIVAVAVDTLLANLTPDGNFGSLAYTQADVLPVTQLASVFGVGGILFLLMLVNSALGFALTYGLRPRGSAALYGVTVLVVALVVGLGWWRLQHFPQGSRVSFGIASVDDFIEAPNSATARDVWTQYQAQVQELAGSGAKLVLLPEKIDVLPAEDAERRKQWLARIARENKVWLVAGLGVDNGHERRNEAWWFAPDGRLVTNYLKHFMAPPEREFVAGHEFPVNDIAGVRYGVAICKDMHFASLGRGFGKRNVRVMLVPAWDFDTDAQMAANMTKLRGVENGYAVVRASRNGLLSITDAYGRVLAVEKSDRLPGTTLFATVKVGDAITTIYSRLGDLPGWACVIAAIIMTLLAFRHVRRERILAELNA